MWFLYLLGLVIALIIDYVIAKNFEEIAEMKGHEGSTYFWFTFILGIVGMLMVIALPDASVKTYQHSNVPPRVSPSAQSKTVAPASQSQAVHAWRCDSCGKMATQTPCEHCGK